MLQLVPLALRFNRRLVRILRMRVDALAAFETV